MKVRNVLTALIFIICILTIIAGKIHWNQKINAAGNAADRTSSEEFKQETEAGKIDSLTRHLPGELVTKIEKAKEKGETLHIVAIGSEATAEGSGTWTSVLQSKLDRTYGKGLFQVIVENYGDDLSVTVVQQEKYTSAVEHEPDIVLFEPFILNDNGKVAMTNTLESIDIIMNKFQETVEDVVIMLQPPNPIHNAIHYPGQVQTLKAYAEEHSIIYLDHWSSWPDLDSEEMLEYVDEENELPSKKGHQVWGEYIGKYFTGEELD